MITPCLNNTHYYHRDLRYVIGGEGLMNEKN